MRNVRAVVVGVSRYYSSSWKTDGPARNAAAIANWLLGLGVKGDRIHLFAELPMVDPAQAAKLGALGVVAREPRHPAINEFWRVELPRLAEEGDLLFFFWSGHGMTDAASQRVFFCGDYSPQLPTSVLNMNEVLAMLRSSPYQRYSKQLFIADVCGTYAESPIAPTCSVPADVASVDQFMAFATREGEYAEMDDKMGIFTDAVLEAFALIGRRWPEEDLLRPALVKVSSQLPQQPYTVYIKGRQGETHGQPFGSGRSGRLALANSAYKMLQDHDTGNVQTGHYERTMSGLGLATSPYSTTLFAIVRELADLQDVRDGQAPYGLVEFLARLAGDPRLARHCAEAIGHWIAANGKDRLREAEERICLDQSTRKLLFEVRPATGRLCEVETFLRFNDMMPVPGFQSKVAKVDNWQQLGEVVRQNLDQVEKSPQTGDIELHFLADADLFDLPFHAIEAADGQPVGQHHVCIVHSLKRALSPDGMLAIMLWRKWSETIPLQSFPQVPWQKVKPTPEVGGFCYADFAVVPTPQGSVGKKQIEGLIKLGAPVVCWPHAELEEMGLREYLSELAKGAVELGGLPAAFLVQRMLRHPVASGFTLLCDEPNFRPFVMMQGAG
ncbi:caspase family protein [Devosia sp.]|uniref:VMAP-C domain-containing protein n=1 Tax=Devosia sp. TaxID=1871048 RepID=UPI003265D0AD